MGGHNEQGVAGDTQGEHTAKNKVEKLPSALEVNEWGTNSFAEGAVVSEYLSCHFHLVLCLPQLSRQLLQIITADSVCEETEPTARKTEIWEN